MQEGVCNDITIITTTKPLKNKSSEAKLFKLLRLVEMQTSDNTRIELDSLERKIQMLPCKSEKIANNICLLF